MKRRAFTLIELLVVIAIIAILAAILFPVFAQAKAAAKKTTALSNIKQMATATAIYSSDADDVVPLLLTDGNQYGGGTYGTLTWLDTIQPYTKNYDLIFDPVSPYQTRGGYGSSPVTYGSFADYWFQMGGLPTAASVGGGSNVWHTRTAAWYQVYTKANLAYDGIMGIATTPTESYWGSGWGWTPGESHPSRSVTSLSAPADYAAYFSANNFDGWHAIYGYAGVGGTGLGFCGGWVGYDYSFFGFQPRHTGGQNLCDVNTRQTMYGKGQSLIAFADGHAKAMSPGQLLTDDGAGNLKHFSPDAK